MYILIIISATYTRIKDNIIETYITIIVIKLQEQYSPK
jgi:hypothetical protein